MKCLNCGNEVKPGDTFCATCGARVMQNNATNNGDGQRLSTQHSSHGDYKSHNAANKKNKGPLIIIIALLVACSLVGGALYMGFAHQDEETLWTLCQQSKDLNDIKQYIDDYPNGEHIAEAKSLYSQLISEKTSWEQAMASGEEDVLRAFINNHPSSNYLAQARDMLDDAVWNNALERNTKDGFQRYITEFPTGKHVGEARSHFNELQRAELTLDERQRVNQCISQFLNGMSQWDIVAMMSVCNVEMDNFMGKRPASHNDVRDYFNAYRESDIDSIGFSSLAVDVKKQLQEGGDVQYNASFTVTRNFRRENTQNGTMALLRGEAVVDNYFRFKSLEMDKIKEQ